MASWNDPSNSNPVHVNLLQDLANKDTYSATMGQVNLGAYTDLPDGTMNWDNGQKLLRRVQSGTPEVVKISLAGGGTGASDAAGARAAFNVLEAGTGATQSRTNTQNDARFIRQSSDFSELTQPNSAFDNIKQPASTTATGVVEKATNAEIEAGTADKYPDCAAIQGYYGAASTLSASQVIISGASGDLISGRARLVKRFGVVQCSGEFSHSSGTSISSAAGFIPSNYRPGFIDNDYATNAYMAFNGLTPVSKQVKIHSDGTLSFNYSSADTETNVFSIIYTLS